MLNFNWVSKMKAEKAMNGLRDFLNSLIEENAELKEKLYNFNKDKELKKYEKDLSDVYKKSIHVMTDEEKESAGQFMMEHSKKCEMKKHIRYIVSPTPLGNVVEIQCIQCSEKKDITDVQHW